MAEGVLGRLTSDDRDALAALGHERQVPVRTPLFNEGEPAYEVAFVLEGAIKVVRTSSDGREVVLAVRHPGDIVGDMSALDGGVRSAGAVAMEPSRLLVVPVPAFLDVLDHRPGLSRAILVELVARLRQSADQALEFGVDDALTRVCRRLLEMAESHGRPEGAGTVLEVPVSQQELADRSGLSREAVVKALRALRSLGWIESSGRTVVLTDEPALRSRAGWA